MCTARAGIPLSQLIIVSLAWPTHTLLSHAHRYSFSKVVLYVEQEPASGPRQSGRSSATSINNRGVDSDSDLDSDSDADARLWTVADALTEPMVAGPSASTPEAMRHAEALLAVRAYWAATAATQEAEALAPGGTGPEKDKDTAEEAMSTAMDLMGSADGGWELDERLEELASRLDVGAAAFRRRPVSSLSGGERKRVALAAALAQNVDVLLLDEPTNHLDWEAIDWLADHLNARSRSARSQGRALSLLLVTHDRYFLERTCDEVLELDSAAVHRYREEGGSNVYATYLRRREERLAAEAGDLGRQAKILKREAAWDAKGARAQQAKSKSRAAAYQDLKEATTGANTRAHTSIDELGVPTNSNKGNAGRVPGDGTALKKSESTQALNSKKARFQTLDQSQSGPVVPLYKLPHKQRNPARNTQSLNRGESASSGEAGFDHYMATPDKNPAKVQRLRKAKG